MHKKNKSMQKNILSLLLFFLFQYNLLGQELAVKELYKYVQSVNEFAKVLPQEKVYLHFDNTNYYKGDDIWFKCYVVTSELNQATQLSRTLYVELLNPGGEIINKQVLRIENGQCHGSLSLTGPVFYSGYYEVRAYTKYMLNFGEDVIFSRTFPVFDSSKEEGEYQQEMKWVKNNYPQHRKEIKKGKKVNVTFYPEGGNLVSGIESQVAFQAADEKGIPISVDGIITDSKNQEIVRFSTSHQGRGTFIYTPVEGKVKVKVKYKNKEHDVKIPEVLPEGYVMRVNNPFQSDSIEIDVKKNTGMVSDTLGLAIMSRGKIYNLYVIEVLDGENSIQKISRKRLPPGVLQILLFNRRGEILSDRLIFINADNYLTIEQNQDKTRFNPYEAVDMDFSVKDKQGIPVSTTFSLSVRDASDGITYTDNILTNLLLSSEIKGYIDNPSYYFEKDDEEHWNHLDLLMQVQGWRRYVWKQMSGLEPFDLKYLPEQSISMKGHVRSLVRKVPKPNVDVSLYMTEKDKEIDERNAIVQTAQTDSLGNFRLSCDLDGRWDMVFVTMEKNKKKNYDVIFDRLFSPGPRGYTHYETRVKRSDGKDDFAEDLEELPNLFDSVPDDSVSLGIDQKVHHLKEVTVTAKKSYAEREREDNLKNSIALYTVSDELEDIMDNGGYVGDDIYAFLKNVNDQIVVFGSTCKYKGKALLFVVNNRSREDGKGGSDGYEEAAIGYLRLSDVETIYLSEAISLIMKYKPPLMKMDDALSAYSAVIFIETYKDGKSRPKRKGVRKVTLNGYSILKEFYSPDYKALPPEPDYRRTLYWNPDVQTDENGKAKVQFYNNSTCRQMIISAETITSNGVPGVYIAD